MYLTPRDDNNFSHYKDLVKNDSLRVTMMLFIDQVPGLEMKTLTSRTTLKSFQEDARIIELVKPIKDNAVTQEDRYAFVGLFLESILFEMVDSPRGKRSKSRIVNYIVDLLCRSGM